MSGNDLDEAVPQPNRPPSPARGMNEHPASPRGSAAGPREVRLEALPRLSLVILPGDDTARLADLLAALLPRCPRDRCEVLVVVGPGVSVAVPEPAGAVRVVVAGSAGVREARAAGMDAADGDIVAFIEGCEPLSSHWVDALTRDPREGRPEPEPGDDADWASRFAR